MSYKDLANLDLSAWNAPEPTDDLRVELTDWYRYQRHEFQRKLRDLTPEQLAAFSVEPVQLSVLGLVRHMTQMEEGYVGWGLLGGTNPMRYGEEDYAGGTVDSLDDDLEIYFEAVGAADHAIASIDSLDTPGAGNGRPLRWVLLKMIDEYAIHAGQAHM
ncbi:MAG: DUF664 domain-containing protein, partial [Acidimicrobiia bacterium]